jgi:DNA-binding NarL/FixJ family response regulator
LGATKFFVIDQDYRVRNSLARALDQYGSVVQLDHIEEIGRIEDRETYVLMADHGQVIDDCLKLNEYGTFCFTIAYHENPSLVRVVECLSGPLNGYLQWPGDQLELEATLKALSTDATSQVRRKIARSKAQQKLKMLSARELQVAKGVAEGLSSKELAIELGVSFRTVEFHRANVMTKLGAKNIASVVRIVIEAGTGPRKSSSGLDVAA